MTWPLEGSREIDEGIIISEPMDWCKSPTAIVPYKIYAYQREAMNLADSVRQTSDPTHVKGSIVLKCYGDEPGVGGGVISGTHNAECTPKTWSESVTAQGRNVVRHDDEWWMNHKNTWGRLYYTKDMNLYAEPSPEKIDPKMLLEKSIGKIPEGADKYEALFGGDDAVEWGVGGLIVAGAAGALTLRSILVNGVKVQIYTGSRTSQRPNKCPCVVAPYLALRYVCGKACKDGQAHHIVPDYTKRYGSRIEGELGFKRIKGLANFQEGASICMKGNAKDDDTEHYEAHQADKDVSDLGMDHPDSKQYPIGTAPISEIRRLTEQQAKNARPECSSEIEADVAAEFANVNGNTLGRAYFDSRFPPSTNTVPALSQPTIH